MSDANLNDLASLVAAGGNSSTARSIRVRDQLRDRFGRWIDMGRSVKGKARKNGKTVGFVGDFLGGVPNRPGYGYVLVQEDKENGIERGVIEANGRVLQQVLAGLSPEALEKAGIKLGKDINGNSIGDVLDADIDDWENLNWRPATDLDEALAKGELSEGEKEIARLSRDENPDSDYESHNVIATIDEGTEADTAKGADVAKEALAPSDSEMVRASSLKAGDKVRVNGEVKTVKSVSSTDSGDMVTFTDRKFKMYDDFTQAEKIKSTEEPTQAQLPEDTQLRGVIPTSTAKTGLENLTDEQVAKRARQEADLENAPARTDGQIGMLVPGRSARREADKRGIDYPGKLIIPDNSKKKPAESAIPTPETIAELERLYGASLEKQSDAELLKNLAEEDKRKFEDMKKGNAVLIKSALLEEAKKRGLVDEDGQPIKKANLPTEDRTTTLAREMNEISNKVNNLEYEARQRRLYGEKNDANTARIAELDSQIDELVKEYNAKREEFDSLQPDTSAQDAQANLDAIKEGIQWYDNKDGDLAKMLDNGATGAEVLDWLRTNSEAWNQAEEDFDSAWAVDLPQPLQRARWKKFEKLRSNIEALQGGTPTQEEKIADLTPEESTSEDEKLATDLAEEAEANDSLTRAEATTQIVSELRQAIRDRDGLAMVDAASRLAMLARRTEDSITGDDKASLNEIGRLRLVRSFAMDLLQSHKTSSKKRKEEREFLKANAGLTEAYVPDTVELDETPEGSNDTTESVNDAFRTNEDQLDVTQLTNGQAKLIESLRNGKKSAMDAMVQAAARDDVEGYARAKVLAGLYTEKLNVTVAGFQEGKSEKDFFSGIDRRMENFNLIKESLEYGQGTGDDAGREVLKKAEAIVIGKSGKPYLIRWSYDQYGFTLPTGSRDSQSRVVTAHEIINGIPSETAVGFQRLGYGGSSWHFENDPTYGRKINGEYAVTPAFLKVYSSAQSDGLGAFLTLGGQFALQESGRRFAHSHHLLPSGNRNSKYTSVHNPDLHAPSQIERLLYTHDSKLSKLMEGLGWYKGKRYGGGLSFRHGSPSNPRDFTNIKKPFDETDAGGVMDSFKQEGMLWEMEEGMKYLAEVWKISSRDTLPPIFQRYANDGVEGMDDFSLINILKDLAYTDGIDKQEAVIRFRAIADSLNSEVPPQSSRYAPRANEMRLEIQTRINELADALEGSNFSDADKLKRRRLVKEELPQINADPFDGDQEQARAEMSQLIESLGADLPPIERIVDGNMWAQGARVLSHDEDIIAEADVSENDLSARISPLIANDRILLNDLANQTVDLGAANPDNVEDADWAALDEVFRRNGVITHPRTIARNFSTSLLKEAYLDALKRRVGSVTINRGSATNRVSLLSVRDALQMQGVNTNDLVQNAEPAVRVGLVKPPQVLEVSKSADFSGGTKSTLKIGEGPSRLTVSLGDDESGNPETLRIVKYADDKDTVGRAVGQIVRTEDGRYNVYYFGGNSLIEGDNSLDELNGIVPIGTVTSRAEGMQYINTRAKADLNLEQGPINVASPDELTGEVVIDAVFTRLEVGDPNIVSVTEVRRGLAGDGFTVTRRLSGSVSVSTGAESIGGIAKSPSSSGAFRADWKDASNNIHTRYFSNQADAERWVGDNLGRRYSVSKNFISGEDLTPDSDQTFTSVASRRGASVLPAEDSNSGMDEVRSFGTIEGSDGTVSPYTVMDFQAENVPANITGRVFEVRIGRDSYPADSYEDFSPRNNFGQFSIVRNPDNTYRGITSINTEESFNATTTDETFPTREEAESYLQDKLNEYVGISDFSPFKVSAEDATPVATPAQPVNRLAPPTAPSTTPATPTTPARPSTRNSTTITPASGRVAQRSQLVLDEVKNTFPDHKVLPNGDILVDTRDYQMSGRDGRTFRYEVVLHKKANQDFVAYVRQYQIDSNGNQVGEVTTGLFTDPSQSPVVTVKRIKKLIKGKGPGQGIRGTNPTNWFSNNSASHQPEIEDPSTGQLLPENLVGERSSQRFIGDTGIPETGDGTRDAMIAQIASAFGLVSSDEQRENLARQLIDGWQNGNGGLTKSQAADVIDRILANRNAPGANMIPYPSSDAKTIVREGDRVKHANGRTGTVVKRIREIRYARNGVDYSYEDVVYVRYDNAPAGQGTARLTTKNLTVLKRRDGSEPLPATSIEVGSSTGNAVEPATPGDKWDNDVETGAVAYLGTSGVSGIDQTDPPTISMIKTRSGKYMVTIQVNGDSKPITRIFSSQQEADAWAHSGLNKIANGEDVG